MYIRSKENRQTVEDNNPIIDLDNASYGHNLQNQLITVTKRTTITEIKYLPDGLRYLKSTPNKIVQYHYNLDGKVIAESDSTGNITADYVWGLDKALAKKDIQSGNTYYYLYNGHGEMVQIIDSSSQVVNNYANDERETCFRIFL